YKQYFIIHYFLSSYIVNVSIAPILLKNSKI
ncbi:MAG: hypothetical protein ACI9XC_001626, partial [Gammaproteobacteria bacterium]